MVVVTLYCAIVGEARSTFVVEFDDSESVGQLKDAIKENQELKGFASKLQLFLAKKNGGLWVTENDVNSGVGNTAGMKHLDVIRLELHSVGLSDEEIRFDDRNGPVNVLVELPTASSIRIGESAKLELYEGVAENLQGCTEVKNLVEIIKTIQEESKLYDGYKMPFIVLENSSGTGKTQMAFNLQVTRQCDVFYVLCTGQKDRCQTVYGAFEERTSEFISCIETDAKKLGTEQGYVSDFLESSSLLIYGFIIAALRGMDAVSGLKATREEVESALQDRRNKTKKPFVFFLDEFPRVGNRKGDDNYDQMKHARMMRNVFRSFYIIVVVSATNGTARDLLTFSTNSRGFLSSGEAIRWCWVVLSLPGFATVTKLDPLFLWIIKHSRPLFAYRAQLYMVKNPYVRSGKDRLGYLTDMTKELAKVLRQLKKRSAGNEFELGQFCMLLCSSYKPIDDRVNLIDGHFGCLEETTPFNLVLDDNGISKVVRNDT